MAKLIERCAGIDIGKRFLLCYVMTGAAHEEPRSETRRFDTTVPGLERLRNWLNDEHVTDVVMESTGSYWIPIFNLLEGHITVVLANPEEVKNRKGHKTDRKDAEHLADLLRHNHVRSSYIPAEPVRQLRDLTRRRVQLTQQNAGEREPSLHLRYSQRENSILLWNVSLRKQAFALRTRIVSAMAIYRQLPPFHQYDSISSAARKFY